MKTKGRAKDMLLKRTRILWSTKEKNCTQNERTNTNTEAISKRDSVTIFMYTKGCFIARYLSPLIRARWNRDAMVRLGNARVRNFNKQYPMGWSDIRSIITAMKGGWIAAPTRKSVDANNASKILCQKTTVRLYIFFILAYIFTCFKHMVPYIYNVQVLLIRVNLPN